MTISHRKTLLEGNKIGNFLKTLYACLSTDHYQRRNIVQELVALHNEQLIDIIQAFEPLRNTFSDGPNFFQIRSIFEAALPDLNAQVLPVMQTVLELYRDAGQDMAAGAIIDSFIEFCAKQESRPQQALLEIESDPDQFADLLTATLIAGSRIDNSAYQSATLQICEHENVKLKKCALFAVGRLNWVEETKMLDIALATLERSAENDTDDHILGCILKSAFELYQQDKTNQSRIIVLIATALEKGNDYTIHAASELFGFYTGDLPESLTDTLLTALKRVNPVNGGTLNNIDFGLSHLLKTENPEKAIRLLEELLLTNPNELTTNIFDGAAGEFLCNKVLLAKILTRWFLSGERELCEGVYSITQKHHGEDLLLEIDPCELDLANSMQLIFIARKALGYLFMQPISAATVLISLMQHTQNDEVLVALGQLLVDPLLLNYTGKAREFVVKQAQLESGTVKQTLENALKTIDEYLVDLQSVGNLPALHPNEAQRESHYRHISQLMAESSKAAEAKSVFLNLSSKSVLLYGIKSINHMYGPDGKSRRMEVPLHSHSVDMEFPRMDNIDPFGLDYMLRIFRNERFKV